MLSRSARLAAVVIMAQSFVGVTPAHAAPRLECGDFPVICCNASTDCTSGIFCCYYDKDGVQSSCGCNSAQ
jgi:hypothetical protein